MAYTNITYNNPNKVNASKVDNSNRFKINDKMLAMMSKNPALGIGYLIGSAIGENYFGKKRQKSTEDAANDALAQYGQTPALQAGGMDWDAANKILDAYTGGSKNAMNTDSVVDAMNQSKGWAVPPEQLNTSPVPAAPQGEAAPVVPPPVSVQETAPVVNGIGVPPTPQQANAPAVTLDNVGALGGMVSAQDMWNGMKNQGTYNNGNTGLYTNGIRNMDNVVTANPAQANIMAKRAQELENMRWKALNQIGQNPPTPQYFIKR